MKVTIRGENNILMEVNLDDLSMSYTGTSATAFASLTLDNQTPQEITKVLFKLKSDPNYKGFERLDGQNIRFSLTKEGGYMCKQLCTAFNRLDIDKLLTKDVNEFASYKENIDSCADKYVLGLIKYFDFYLGYLGKPHKLDKRDNFKAAADAALKNKKIATGIKVIDEKVVKRLEIQNKINNYEKEIAALKKELAEMDSVLEDISDLNV